MKTPTEIYKLLKREFTELSLNVDTPSYETTGTYEFKQNNFDIFFSYDYHVVTKDFDNEDFFTPSDFMVKIINLRADRIEICFKGDEIVLTDEQYEDLKQLLTIAIN